MNVAAQDNHASHSSASHSSASPSADADSDLVAQGLRASARRMIGIGVFSGVVNLLTLSGSLYMLQVYDRVIPSRNLATLAGLSAIVLLAYAAQGYFDALRTRLLSRAATAFDAGLQEPIHTALATLPLRGAKPLLALQPLRDLDQIRAFLSGMGPTAFLDMPWIPIFLVALFVFHPAIGATAVIGIVSIVAVTVLSHRLSRDAAKLAMHASAQRQVLADAIRHHAEVIRALGMLGRLNTRWSRANEHFLQESIRSTDLYANLGSVAKALRYVLQSGILGVGAYLVVAGKASGGVMIASSIMMGRALAPIEVALANWKQLAAARQALARLRDILKATAPPPLPPVSLPRPERHLKVEGITVAPPGSDSAVVSDVSFALTAGTGLALLGTSASGKTTLAKALVGIWPARHGVVRLDDATIDQWHNDEFGRFIGYMPQDVSLFDGTVADNICRFEESPSSEAILKAAQIAGVNDMILRLPQGYATRIGEDGASLSAGQRQRIGLARAVYGDPFLVVLDEPNANLDTEGEIALGRAIQRLREDGAIVIVISHRPSALAVLNMALILHQGRVMAFGPNEQVFARAREAARANAVVPPRSDPPEKQEQQLARIEGQLA